MSDIYLEATIEKNWRSQNLNFVSLKNSSLGQLSWGAPAQEDIIEF